jgi:cell division cycle 2-like protein
VATTPLYRFPLRHWAGAGPAQDYDKLNDIEEGTYGWVVRARRVSTGQVVALKRLKTDPQDRNGLPVTGLREIQILKRCNHRNVVALQDVVVSRDRLDM